jgi:hypothetical protein
MESVSSLPRSQEPATCPYPEQDQSNPCHPSHFSQINFNIILASTPRFAVKIQYAPLLSPIRATYPVHLSFLDLITRMIFVYLHYGRLVLFRRFFYVYINNCWPGLVSIKTH